jgi:adenosylcobinamide-GDP ribazoletransferase
MSDEPTNVLDEPATSAEERASVWAAFATAVQFLTRIPLPTGDHAPSASLRRSPAYFPLVGALIGLFTAAFIGATSFLWPAWLAVILALAIEARLTGALHEDAVADFCDAFGGGWTLDDVLTILKDSRIGTYGVLGLALAVALRAGATFEVIRLTGRENWLAWVSAVVASASIGRWMLVAMMLWVPPIARRESLSRDVASQLTWRDLLLATVWTLPAAAIFAWQFPLQAVFAAVLLVIATTWFTRLVVRRIGGMTGDCLGAIGYFSQVLVLLAAAARWPL